MTDYYASPAGGGNGLSSGSPFLVAAFNALPPGPGDRLRLLDGTYTGSPNMLAPTQGNGTPANPITVAAINEGAVLFDGENVRYPVHCRGVHYWDIQGINAKRSVGDVVAAAQDAGHCTFRRICAWDSAGENTQIFGAHGSDHVLFEDCAAWGTADVMFSNSQYADYATYRRCLGIWMGSTGWNVKKVFEWSYNSQHALLENSIGTWTAENQPFSHSVSYGGVTLNYTNYGMRRPVGIFGGDAPSPGMDSDYSRFLGCISYTEAGGAIPLNFEYGFFVSKHDDVEILNCTSRIAQSTIYPFGLYSKNSPATAQRVSITSSTGIGGLASIISPVWTPTLMRLRTDGAGLTLPVDGAGATIRKRYVDGVLTVDNLWPWPMAARIQTALADSGHTTTAAAVAAWLAARAAEAAGEDLGTPLAPIATVDVPEAEAVTASERAKRQWAAWGRQGQTETVTWRPAAGQARAIRALVTRGGREPNQHVAGRELRAVVLVDDTLGVPSPANIDLGVDQLDVAQRRGGTPTARRIRDLDESEDPDFVTLALE